MLIGLLITMRESTHEFKFTSISHQKAYKYVSGIDRLTLEKRVALKELTVLVLSDANCTPTLLKISQFKLNKFELSSPRLYMRKLSLKRI